MTITFHLHQINKIALELWQKHHHYKIWTFDAPMGAGKTTLIRALCNVLQVNDSVSSPTFAIINEYYSPLAGSIYHMDWYRLKDETEVIQAGCADYLESGNLCLIEWSEKALNLLPANILHVSVEILKSKERRLIIN